MDAQQAIYDAVRSKISNTDVGAAIERAIGNMDLSSYAQNVSQEFLNVAYEMQRPSVIFKPKLSLDGNRWCALLGDNLQEGVSAFGDSPSAAMSEFDSAFCKVVGL